MFSRILRRSGLQISTGQVMDALRALECVGFENRREVQQALSCIFLTQHEQKELFEQAFELFFGQKTLALATNSAAGECPRSRRISARLLDAFAAESNLAASPTPRQQTETCEENASLTYSAKEILRRKDFADFTADELDQAREMLRQMRWTISEKRRRRFRRDAKGPAFDLRRTMRQLMRSQGEIATLQRRKPASKPRDIIILCDISGSMERYSRMLLHFMHVFSSSSRKVEAFVFGTRLTRITHLLRHREIDAAVRSVAKDVNDWAGGTRIGEALKAFNFVWARRTLRSSGVVLIISDGWDRGEVPLLESEMGRLWRSCHRLIWLNPLLGSPRYEPLSRGILAALPFVDDFLPVHNLVSLEQIGDVLSRV